MEDVMMCIYVSTVMITITANIGDSDGLIGDWDCASQ